jgi:large subunit ribosomal protein L4e
VGNDSKLVKLSRSITGVDVKHIKDVSVLDLAPGSKPIRLTIFSQNAVDQMKSMQAPMHKLMELINK